LVEKAGILPPEAVLRHLDLAPGHRLLDLGAGPGYFAVPAARLVTPGGVVVAADVQPAMLDALMGRLREALPVVPVHTTESALPFPDRFFDAALAAHVLGECVAPKSLLEEVRRTLRPGGRLLVVDWRPDAHGPGPPAGDRLAPDTVSRLLREAGFTAPILPEVGPHHFAALATLREVSHTPHARRAHT
jgi:ubiquinone/menaquinone biosynthesis C-methylase UbiE